jgi:hypothetical protein
MAIGSCEAATRRAITEAIDYGIQYDRKEFRLGVTGERFTTPELQQLDLREFAFRTRARNLVRAHFQSHCFASLYTERSCLALAHNRGPEKGGILCYNSSGHGTSVTRITCFSNNFFVLHEYFISQLGLNLTL